MPLDKIPLDKCDSPECEGGHCRSTGLKDICPVYTRTVQTSLAAGRVLGSELSHADKIMLDFMVRSHQMRIEEARDFHVI